eukprot:357715-Chlamydomonas_euryale.AAC.7
MIRFGLKQGAEGRGAGEGVGARCSGFQGCQGQMDMLVGQHGSSQAEHSGEAEAVHACHAQRHAGTSMRSAHPPAGLLAAGGVPVRAPGRRFDGWSDRCAACSAACMNGHA